MEKEVLIGKIGEQLINPSRGIIYWTKNPFGDLLKMDPIQALKVTKKSS